MSGWDFGIIGSRSSGWSRLSAEPGCHRPIIDRRQAMALIEQRLRELGLALPPPVVPPAGVILPFQFVRVAGNRALISGHAPLNADGTIAARWARSEAT
jgi:hypothetical protein